MRSLSLALVLSAGLGCCLGSTPANGDDPCRALASAKSFSLGLEVYRGELLSGDRAFLEISQRPDAESCFEKIMLTGTVEGQMYAMVGLRELAPDRFVTELNRLKERPFSVTVAATKELGALRHRDSEDVLADIERGIYRHLFEFARSHKLPQPHTY